MVQRATVVRVNGTLMAQTIRSEACAQCRACAHGQTERQLLPIPANLAVQEGEEVELLFPEGGVGRASLISYGVPFAGFALGLWLGAAAANAWGLSQDLCCAAGALVGTAAAWLIVRRAGRSLKQRGCLEIEVRRPAG